MAACAATWFNSARRSGVKAPRFRSFSRYSNPVIRPCLTKGARTRVRPDLDQIGVTAETGIGHGVVEQDGLLGMEHEIDDAERRGDSGRPSRVSSAGSA